MRDFRPLTCCFTGHRDVPAAEVYRVGRRTEEAIRGLIANGVRYFGVGGTIGYDTLAACIQFRIRETKFSQIR